MLKKIGSFLIVTIMVMAILTPLTAMAATSGQCGDNLFWTLDDSGTLTISGTGDMWNWTFSSLAPWESTYVNNVVINYGVTSIGDFAFYGCDSLTSINIPDSVISIGNNAFGWCESLTTISIPGSVTSIGDHAFYVCDSLTTISIPASVTSIGGIAFDYCDSLMAIFVDENNPNYRDINGVLYSKDRKTLFCYPTGKMETYYTIPDGVTSIGDGAFAYCDSLASISIPSSVTSIGDSAFAFCKKLTTISIPSSVTSIGGFVFDYCDSLVAIFVDENNPNYRDINGVLYSKDRKTLFCYPAGKMETYYTIPDGVTSIGDGAFAYCGSLASISIPSSVTSIGDKAFFGCDSLTSISIPSGVTSIGEEAFSYCYSLTSISIPDSVTSIGHYAFTFCFSLTTIDIPDSVTDMGEAVFLNCHSLTSINIPYGVSSIGNDMFYCCGSLTTINVPDSVTSVGNMAFYGCSITSLNLPFGVISIGDDAFFKCNIESIIIPYSVTSIGYNAFGECVNLADIYYGGSEAEWRALAKDAKVPETTKVHYGNNYSVAPGTVIGSALRTDITATINGHAIPSFNVDGYTYIVAEDLKDYGFSVYYDNSTRTLAINRDDSKTDVTRNYVKPYVAESEVGIKEHNLVATDIVTYLDNNYVQSYNINGLTIIPFNELGRYGAVYYDDSSRTIRATIPRLN